MDYKIKRSIALAAFMPTILSASAAYAQSDDPIVIGLATAKTGFMVSYDGPADTGVALAIADINARGGVLGRQLTTVSADTQSDVAQGAVAAMQVIEEGADFVVVSCDFDWGAPSAVAAASQGRIAFSACAASPKFDVAGLGPLAYTMGSSAPGEGKFLARYAYQNTEWRRAYVLLDTLAEYGKGICEGFEEEWEKLGGEIAGRDTFVNSDTSVAAQVTRYKGAPEASDFILMCSTVPGGVTAIRQFRSGGGRYADPDR